MEEIQELKTENTNTKGNEIYRIAVTLEAEKALIELMEKVNRDFDGGKVSRSELASWMLIRANKDLDESILQDVRADHFDEVAALEALYRKAKETGKVSNELKQILLKQGGFDSVGKKAPKQKIDK